MPRVCSITLANRAPAPRNILVCEGLPGLLEELQVICARPPYNGPKTLSRASGQGTLLP